MRAGNVRNFAYLEQAELTRRQEGQAGAPAERIEINLAQALAQDPAHNLALQNFDHLLVRQQPNIELQHDVTLPGAISSTAIHPLIPDDEQAAALRRAGGVVEHNVDIRGEVQFPGTYPILKGERLSSVLRRAGGYTGQAYLRGAVFARGSVQEQQEKRLQEFLHSEEEALLAKSAAEATDALSPEGIQGEQQAFEARRQLLARLRAVKPEGRMVVRLGALDTFADSDHDIELQPGDRLHIPQTPKHISVLGQVYNPTALLYEPGKALSYYLEQVGGIKSEAYEKEIHLVQVNGTVISNSQDEFLWLRDDGSTTYLGDFYAIQPQPGDTIIVPRRLKSPSWRQTRDIVQIIFQSISTLGVIAALL
jgi:protein involved in polysaccharide export with SLBB domain